MHNSISNAIQPFVGHSGFDLRRNFIYSGKIMNIRESCAHTFVRKLVGIWLNTLRIVRKLAVNLRCVGQKLSFSIILIPVNLNYLTDPLLQLSFRELILGCIHQWVFGLNWAAECRSYKLRTFSLSYNFPGLRSVNSSLFFLPLSTSFWNHIRSCPARSNVFILRWTSLRFSDGSSRIDWAW